MYGSNIVYVEFYTICGCRHPLKVLPAPPTDKGGLLRLLPGAVDGSSEIPRVAAFGCYSPTADPGQEVASLSPILQLKKLRPRGRLGGSVSYVSDFGSGHDPAVCGFKLRVGLCADSSEPGACFRFCVSLSLPLPARALSLSLSLSLSQK